MAVRPLFIPSSRKNSLIERIDLNFQWHAGMALTQKQKSIRSLHESASLKGFERILEISSKSENPIGVKLSAFNLRCRLANGKHVSVENIYQAGKCFEHGGPFLELLNKTAREAKQDPRLGCSGNLVAFDLNGEAWPLIPVTAFYDWVYLSALRQSPLLAEKLMDFDGFTDIEFNPERSLNCQAASAALFVALARGGELEKTLANRDSFLRRLSTSGTILASAQSSLF